MFSFNLNDVKQPSAVRYLKPYNIYNDVSISNVEIKEGTSVNGNAWKAIQLTFSCAEGIYNHSIFYVNSDKDFERTEMDMPNGGKRELPSSWERTRDTMAAIGFAFFPEDFAKMQAASSKAKSFDDIAEMFVRCVTKNKGRISTKMKLIGSNRNGSVYAALPNCTGIAEAKDEKRASDNNVKVGEWYTWMVSPFGNNLSFSNYEEKKKVEYENAKPTAINNAVDSVGATVDTAPIDSEIDFDSLL